MFWTAAQRELGHSTFIRILPAHPSRRTRGESFRSTRCCSTIQPERRLIGGAQSLCIVRVSVTGIFTSEETGTIMPALLIPYFTPDSSLIRAIHHAAPGRSTLHEDRTSCSFLLTSGKADTLLDSRTTRRSATGRIRALIRLFCS